MNSPAFQFYPEDFISGTLGMEPKEIGGYIVLLCQQWSRGGLPDDDKKLFRLCGVSGKSLHVIRQKFALGEDGLLWNLRLEQERFKQISFRSKQSDRAHSRWSATAMPRHKSGNAKPDAAIVPEGMPEPCSPSPVSDLQTPVRSTHTQGGTVPASEKEAVEWAGMDGIPPEFAKNLYNQCVGRGWVDGAGRNIHSWRNYASHRHAQNRVAKPEQPGPPSTPRTRTMTPLDYKTIIGAKQQMADELKNRYAAEGPLETTWSDLDARKNYFALLKEIREINAKLGGMS